MVRFRLCAARVACPRVPAHVCLHTWAYAYHFATFWVGWVLTTGVLLPARRSARTIPRRFWHEKSNKYHFDTFVVSEKYVGTAFARSGEP